VSINVSRLLGIINTRVVKGMKFQVQCTKGAEKNFVGPGKIRGRIFAPDLSKKS
jgi:hypothetical protein